MVFPVLLFFFLSLLYHSLHESQTQVAEDDLEFLILLPIPPSAEITGVHNYTQFVCWE